MAFLFKSKKNQERERLGSRDGPPVSQGALGAGRMTREEKTAMQRATPTGSLNSLDNDGSAAASPDQIYSRRNPSVDQSSQSSDLPFRNGPQMNNSNSSLYPWSQRRLTLSSSHPSPFPRYGAAVNSNSSKEGDIYVMGGLINSSTVKGDLWMIEAGGSMACYPLATTAEAPGPRVGHASLLVGNAFIVYGGDTKIDESDVLDETLYLLNTSTRQWSRVLPSGARPSGRYGHSLNILGSKIFIFGGQIEGYFMNDLSAFDLNTLQVPINRWDLLVPGSEGPSRDVPAARTNHSMVTYNDKMYLFGGTNGYQWFNDVWCYDAPANKWSQLDCIGYIPVPREGHAAALVDDVMYIFGGRTEEGTDLGDLAAFRISSRRWYTFQNMGPSPSPRSGHSMTTVNKSVVVLGGEPSAPGTTINDLGIVYILDTTKIRYPNDAQLSNTPNSQRAVQGRRPSAASSDQSGPVSRQTPLREEVAPDQKKLMGPPGGQGSSNNSPTNGYKAVPNGVDANGPSSAAPAGSRLPRTAPAAPAGPPPQAPAPSKPPLSTANVGRSRGPSLERNEIASSSPQEAKSSPVTRDVGKETDSAPAPNGLRTPTQTQPQTAGRTGPKDQGATETKTRPKQGRSQGSVDSSSEPKAAIRPSSPPPPSRQTSNPLSRRSSGRNSQTVALLKELDAARNRNAWYASELELARKAGYAPNSALSPSLEGRATETFDDEDKPLIEALLSMKAELANVQAAVDKQAILAAKQIAEADKQRDSAIHEAVYAKAKLAAHVGGSAASTPQMDVDKDSESALERSNDMSKKLALALNTQRDLQAHLESARSELESERRARQLADDTSDTVQKRAAELESYKQQTSTEVDRLRTELHVAQKEARDNSVTCAEAVGALQLLRVEKQDLEARFEEEVGAVKERGDTFVSLREAVAASTESTRLLERRVEEERAQREKVEGKLTKLKAEHEARTAELVAATQRLRDAEELAERHAAEAKTHKQAVLTGLDKLSARDSTKSVKVDADRVTALQGQLTAANALVRKYQQEADGAAEKLRRAEERISGLETYQESSSREGVSIRKQLQSALRDTQSLQAANTELKNSLAAQQLETNSLTIQHNTLKDILSERGISPTNAARARGLGSPRTNSPEQQRLRDLEQRLAAAMDAHEETKKTFLSQAEESEAAYRDKLSTLESDYQSAVHYVKGTERMLKQLQDQLTRYKAENERLRSDLAEAEEKRGADSSSATEWQRDRDNLQREVDELGRRLQASTTQLQDKLSELGRAQKDRDAAVQGSDAAAQKLAISRRDLEQLQQENSLLERRAQDAEEKVSLLLDQVETSVDNYRRRSRQVPSMQSDLTVGANGGGGGGGMGMGHARNDSSEAGSVYGPGGIDARNSTALDNLASELETLRNHWETTNKNYRLSNTFEFDTAVPGRKEEDGGGGGGVGGVGGGVGGGGGMGLSEHLADWRKRLDNEDRVGDSRAERS